METNKNVVFAILRWNSFMTWIARHMFLHGWWEEQIKRWLMWEILKKRGVKGFGFEPHEKPDVSQRRHDYFSEWDVEWAAVGT